MRVSLREKPLAYTTIIGAGLGLVAPVLWWGEFYLRGKHIGAPGTIMDYLIYFFPASILYLAVPYPSPTVAILLNCATTMLNVMLYGLLSFFLGIGARLFVAAVKRVCGAQ